MASRTKKNTPRRRAKRRTYFISGLPRSGSTLLSAILRQNPKFHAGISSPVSLFTSHLISAVSAGKEHAPSVTNEQRKNILRGLFTSYYKGLPINTECVFDTSRSWAAKLPLISDLFPETKVICCVRDVAWVLDSLERQYRSNMYDNTKLFQNAAERTNVFTRTEALMHRQRLVGFSLAALQEAIFGEHANRLLIVEYEQLTRAPDAVLGQIYKFLGEKPYSHDFQNVAFEAKQFDAELGIEGLHTVRPKVEVNNKKTILPPALFEQYSKLSFWRSLNPKNKKYNLNIENSSIVADNATYQAGVETVTESHVSSTISSGKKSEGYVNA